MLLTRRFKFIWLAIVMVLSGISAHAEEAISLELARLDSALEEAPKFIAEKQQKIEHLNGVLAATPADQGVIKYKILSQLHHAYSSYIYDSAFSYATQKLAIAYELKDEQKINESKKDLGFTTLSAGMFKETFDTLSTVKVSALPPEVKLDYYALMARLLYDLCDYDKDRYYCEEYIPQGDKYIQFALGMADPTSYDFLYLSGLKHLRLTDGYQAKQFLEKIFEQEVAMTNHELAIVSSTLSFLYQYDGDTAKAVKLLVDACISDIQSATKETVAMSNLAQLLYRTGNIEKAYEYINIAMADAEWYGARQRISNVGGILPVIAATRLNKVDNQRKNLLGYSVGITALVILILVLGFKSYKQSQFLKKKDAELSKQHADLNAAHNSLQEANQIKEQYLSYYFDLNSEYIEKIEKVKKSIDKKLISKQYDDIRFILSKINVKDERVTLYNSFDKVFLQLFPNFITQFNELFPPEEQFGLDENGQLSTELRIFALVRMGISDSDKLAKILGYSVNTIYAYKNRIKTKSLVANDQFEDKIMAIST